MSVSPAAIMDLLFGYQNTATMKAALELDVFTAIGEGAADVPALAARCAAAERGIAALCDLLVVFGLLHKSAGRYSLSADAAAFLDRRSPAWLGSVHDFIAAPETTSLVLQDPAGAVRRGGSAGLGSIAPDNPAWVRFARGMAPAVAPLATMVAQQAGEKPPRRVLDIAAGHGLYGIAFATRFPACHVTALDWETVIAVARENAAKAGVADRYATIAGSAFEVAWGDGYDVVLLSNFLHHFDAAGCADILRRAHAALVPGGSVAIVEFVPDEDRTSPPRAATFAMTMLLSTPAGAVYTAAELAGMLAEAGFEAPAVTPLPPTPATLLTARRP